MSAGSVLVQSDKSRLDALDGWRTVSVALVIINHMIVFSSIGSRDPAMRVFDGYGHLGVQIFFAISGFVICRGLEKELMRDGRISLAGFHVRRLFRIVPPLLFYLLVLFFLSSASIVTYDHAAFVNALTFTCNFTQGCGGYVGGHLWSLAVEGQFYLAFPLLLVAMAAQRKRVVGMMVLGFPFLLLGLAVLKMPVLATYLSDFLCISAGVFCGQYEIEVRKFAARLPRVTPWLAMLALLGLVYVMGPNIISTLARYFLVPSLIAVMLMTTISRDSAASRLLSLSWMQGIGMASYSIYLWQQLATAPYPGAGILFYSVTLSACMVLSLLSYRYAELPLIRLGSSLSGSLRRSAPAAAL